MRNIDTNLLREHRAAAGRASGAARRARTAQRDAALALERARFPGRSLEALGKPHGLSRSAVLRAVRRARRDPALVPALDAAEAERRQALDASLGRAASILRRVL